MESQNVCTNSQRTSSRNQQHLWVQCSRKMVYPTELVGGTCASRVITKAHHLHIQPETNRNTFPTTRSTGKTQQAKPNQYHCK